jgi:acyl-[acyl carrier protein]--UDP-N-acetylglucosamine O-acyltransferase
MTTGISDKASVDPRAVIAEEVEIGPFCVVGPDAHIGRETRLLNFIQQQQEGRYGRARERRMAA